MPNYRRRRWRDAMAVRVDLNGLLTAMAGPDGIAPAELEALGPELVALRTALAARRAEGRLVAAELPYRRDDVRSIRETAAAVRADFDTLVVLGTGGSVAGVRALATALPAPAGGGPRLVVADSIDPEAMQDLLQGLDLRRTLFDVVSKSGDTADTMAQFLIVRDRLLHELGAVDYKRHVLVTTDAEHGSLRQIVHDEGFRDLVVPPGVEARFAPLTAVGLFPLAAAGHDIEELCAGAVATEERGRAAESPLADPALALGGALWLLATRRQRPGLAVEPYCQALTEVGPWVGELRGEHPPSRAEAVVLFLRVEDHGVALDVPAAYQDLEDVGYLGGHPLGELLNAEQRAAEMALSRRGRPSVTVTLPALNPFTLGQLVFLLEMAAVAGEALAGAAALPRPDEQEIERVACGLLGRPGFAAAREELDAWAARRDPRFVL